MATKNRILGGCGQNQHEIEDLGGDYPIFICTSLTLIRLHHVFVLCSNRRTINWNENTMETWIVNRNFDIDIGISFRQSN